MASNTTEVQSEAFDHASSAQAYLVFRNLFENTYPWYKAPSGGVGWVGFDFKCNRRVTRVEFSQAKYVYGSTTYYGAKQYKIQYSDDKSTWTDATSTMTAQSVVTKQSINIDSGPHRYWRFYILNSTDSNVMYPTVNTVNFIGY